MDINFKIVLFFSLTSFGIHALLGPSKLVILALCFIAWLKFRNHDLLAIRTVSPFKGLVICEILIL